MLAAEFQAIAIPDPGSLPGAINVGIESASPAHAFVTWLGDDDLLTPGSLAATTTALDSHSDAVLAYGSCRYINEKREELWINRAGRWAQWVLPWGPDLIPQPGMLVRRNSWTQVGGLDTSFGMAFDLDLLLRLRQLGSFVDVKQVVSCFRWHSTSLTASDRTRNLEESERAKRAALNPRARRLAWLWERPVRLATRAAAWEVQRRAQRLNSA